MDNSLKDEQKKAWGSLDALGSIDAIVRTCELLESEGLSINREIVRQRSGVGFNNLVAAGIRIYRSHQNNFQDYPDVPKVLFPVIMEALNQGFGDMKAKLAKQKTDEAQHWKQAFQESTHEYSKLECELEQLRIIQEKQTELLESEKGKVTVLQKIVDSKQAHIDELNLVNEQLVVQCETQTRLIESLKALSGLAVQNSQTVLQQTCEFNMEKIIDAESGSMKIYQGDASAAWVAEKRALDNRVNDLSLSLSQKNIALEKAYSRIADLENRLQKTTGNEQEQLT